MGAHLAVEAAADAARTVLPDTPPSAEAADADAHRFRGACLRAFTARLDALLAAAPGHQAGDYAATLLAVVAHPPYFVYLAVGDCFLVARHGRDAAHLVLAPDGDGVANETVFLTSAVRDTAVRSGVLADDGVTGLALATDGLVEATLTARVSATGSRQYAAPAEFADYFAVFAGSAPAGRLAEQFASAEFAATSGDDKTMVIAVRR